MRREAAQCRGHHPTFDEADNSPDGTATIVRRHPEYLSHLFVLKRPKGDGLEAAYRAGFRWALCRDYDVIVQMDADLSHPPERVPDLVAALEGSDVAIDSRYVAGGGIAHWSLIRRLISWGCSTYVRLVLGLPVRDATAGFKALLRTALEQIGTTASASNGCCFQIENTWWAVRVGLRVSEVPITFTHRTSGTSKMSGAILSEALGRVLMWRWQELRGRGLDQRELGRGALGDDHRRGRQRGSHASA